jgi:cell division protein FtsW
MLALLGLVMVLSASSIKSYRASGSSFTVFNRQLLWFVIGLPVMWLAAHLKPRTFRWLAYPLLAASLAGLVLVFVPGLGSSAYGATRWLRFGPVSAQPSELAKLALILWAADLYVRKEKLLRQWKHLLVPMVPVAMLLAGLVMAEPDMGTTLVIVSVAMVLLYVVGTPMRLFGGLLAVLASMVALLAVAEPYRLARLTSFADPFAQKLGTGYQAVQGLYALGSGGWFGVGIGASRQKWSYLPQAHTDYIFGIIGEELGLAGTLVVLLLFAVLAYAGLRVAQRTRDPFVRLGAAGITTWMVVQALVNMGAVTGLLPIARSEPGVAEALAARGPGALQRTRRWARDYYGFRPSPTTTRSPARGRPARTGTATRAR